MDILLHYFLPFVVALTLLVFIHELGHYIPARRSGIKIDVFSIGFGPELFGFYDKHGTRWKFSAIPLGGYVRMFGDADAASRPDAEAKDKLSPEDYSKTLQSKTVWQRIVVSFGGPFANFLFAIIAMFFLFSLKGHPTIPSKVLEVKQESVADRIGLKPQDVITDFNDVKVASFKELREAIQQFKGIELRLKVIRGGEELLLSLKKPSGFEVPFQLGVVPANPEFVKKGILESFVSSFKTTYEISADIVKSIGETLMGKRKASELGGILAIGDMAGKSAQTSGASFVWFLIMLSINLGMLNLFPLPMLDGGHIVFYLVEAVIGRPVPLKIQEYIFLGGFIAVASLMIYITWHDLIRYQIFTKFFALFQ